MKSIRYSERKRFVLSLLIILFSVALILVSCSSEKQTTSNGESGGAGNPENTLEGKKIQPSDASVQQTSANNHLPVITSAKFAYIHKDSESFMNIEVEGKADEGRPLSFVYEWSKNGEPAGNDKQLNSTLKRGDKISVRITPFDGKEYGRSIRLDREISNMFPVIAEQKEIVFDQKLLQYQVKAYDPDGDSLKYALKSGPTGMSIDTNSGLLQWNVPTDFQGSVPVTVSVNDGHGGETLYTFSVTLSPERK